MFPERLMFLETMGYFFISSCFVYDECEGSLCLQLMADGIFKFHHHRGKINGFLQHEVVVKEHRKF